MGGVSAGFAFMGDRAVERDCTLVGQSLCNQTDRALRLALRQAAYKVGSDSTVMVHRTQRRASFKSNSNCRSRSGDAMNPNRV